MLKSLLLGCLFLLLPLSPALAQQSKRAPTPPLDPVTQLVTYKQIVYIANLPQDTLTTRAQRWFQLGQLHDQKGFLSAILLLIKTGC